MTSSIYAYALFQQSISFRCHLRNDASLQIMVEYLGQKRKNRAYYFKDETCNAVLKEILCTSAK